MKMTRNSDTEEPRDLPRVPDEPGHRINSEDTKEQQNEWSPTGTEDPAFYIKPADEE